MCGGLATHAKNFTQEKINYYYMDFENCLKFSEKAIQLLGKAFSLEEF